MSLEKEDKLLDVNKILHKAGVGEDMTVADIGCGPSGHFVFPAAEMVGKKGKVYAIDIMKETLERVRRKAHLENFQNVETVWTNSEIFNGSKLEAGSVDVVLIINTLHQSKHVSAIMREANRLTRKKGVIAVIDWKKVSLPFGPKPNERADEKHVTQIAQNMGLNFEEEFKPGKYHYGLIFQKI